MIIKYAIIIVVIITFSLISLFFCSDVKQSTNKYRKKIGYGKYKKTDEQREKKSARKVVNVKTYEFSDTNKMRRNVKRNININSKTIKNKTERTVSSSRVKKNIRKKTRDKGNKRK